MAAWLLMRSMTHSRPPELHREQPPGFPALFLTTPTPLSQERRVKSMGSGAHNLGLNPDSVMFWLYDLEQVI